MDFDSLHKNTEYKIFFEHFKTINKSKKVKYDNVFYMAMDGEWWQKDNKNIVLSYQIATAAEHRTVNEIHFTDNGKRLKLAEIIENGIRNVYDDQFPSVFRKSKNLVILISHNFVAEWSIMADRNEKLITDRLIQIRKSPVTDKHPIELGVNKAIFDVRFYDTMLLAPASHRSLKKLSALLGDKAKQKETISQYYIENMNLYLRYHYNDYVKYALKDTEVTLQLFFLLQKSLNDLVGKGFQLYVTLASAGVNGFFTADANVKKYFAALRKDKFKRPYRMIKQSYHGGRNENYFAGRTSNHQETKNKFWIDIDFTGAYPTTMALCPRIDPLGEIIFHPTSYKITEKEVDQLVKKNIPKKLIQTAMTAASVSTEALDQFLFNLKNRHHAKVIKKKARVIDNTLINKWFELWERYKMKDYAALEEYLIPGFAQIYFEFEKGTEFPCLPVSHPDYGLIYPLKGKTTATASEIILAMANGAEIKAYASIELPTERNDNGIPKLLTSKHLRTLALQRQEYKNDAGNPKSQALERLVKEFMNSFYGKFAQGINIKRHFKPSTGENEFLMSSRLTEPVVASLVTSLARAALSAVMLSISEFNLSRPQKKDQLTVISSTTDGLLIGVPAPDKNFSVLDKYYGFNKKGEFGVKNGSEEDLVEVLDTCGCGALMQIMDNHLAVRQMRKSREMISDDRSILEVKHMADEVVAVKTRGQIGLLKTGHVSILAKFGQKPPLTDIMEKQIPNKSLAKEEYKRIREAGGIDMNTVEGHWLIEQMDKFESGLEEYIEYPMYQLRGFREIFENSDQSDPTKFLDLTSFTEPRNLNTNFDWKRRLVWDDGTENPSFSPFSEPFEDISEMLKFRDQMESIKSTKTFARPERVLNQIAIQGRSARLRGGEPAAVTRFFLRSLMHEKIPFDEKKHTQAQWAQKINQIWKNLGLDKNYPRTWRANDFSHAKKARYGIGWFQPTVVTKDLVKALSIVFEADLKDVEKLVFNNEKFKFHQTKLMKQVISAIIDARKQDIQPFKKLYEDWHLPNVDQIKRRFKNQLSDEQLESFLKEKFIPKQLSYHHIHELKILFASFGLKTDDATKCARQIVKKATRKKKKDNPRKRKSRKNLCAEMFFLALEAYEAENGREIKDKYKIMAETEFDLSSDVYRNLKEQRFVKGRIKNNAKNRKQIRNMAQSFEIDPNYFIDEMISK